MQGKRARKPVLKSNIPKQQSSNLSPLLGVKSYTTLIKWMLFVFRIPYESETKFVRGQKEYGNNVDFLLDGLRVLLKNKLGADGYKKFVKEITYISQKNQKQNWTEDERKNLIKNIDPEMQLSDLEFREVFWVPKELDFSEEYASVSYFNILQAMIRFDIKDRVTQRTECKIGKYTVFVSPLKIAQIFYQSQLTKHFLNVVGQNPAEYQEFYALKYRLKKQGASSSEKTKAEEEIKHRELLEKFFRSPGEAYKKSVIDVLAGNPFLVFSLLDSASLLEWLKNKSGADININAKCQNDYTLLHKACEKGALKLCEALVDRGADIFATDKNGVTPLLIAIYFEGSDIVSYLIEQAKQKNNSDLLGEIRDINSVTLEHFGCEPGIEQSVLKVRLVSDVAVELKCYEMAEEILRRLGCSEKEVLEKIFISACDARDSEKVSELLPKVELSLFMWANALIKSTKEIFESIHHRLEGSLVIPEILRLIAISAAEKDDFKMLDKLLSAYPSCKADDNFLYKLLKKIIQLQNVSLMKNLLQIIKLKWQKTEIGESLVNLAVKIGQYRMVEFLLESGASDWSNAILLSEEYSNQELTQKLKKKFDPRSLFEEKQQVLPRQGEDSTECQLPEEKHESNSSNRSEDFHLYLLSNDVPPADRVWLKKNNNSSMAPAVVEYIEKRCSMLKQLLELSPQEVFTDFRTSELERELEKRAQPVKEKKEKTSALVAAHGLFQSSGRQNVDEASGQHHVYPVGCTFNEIKSCYTLVQMHRQSPRYYLLWSKLDEVMSTYKSGDVESFMNDGNLRESVCIKFISERKFSAEFKVNGLSCFLEASAELKIRRTKGRILLAILKGEEMGMPTIFVPVKYFPEGFHDNRNKNGARFVAGKINVTKEPRNSFSRGPG